MVKININGNTAFYAEGTVISSTTASDTTLVSGGDYWWYSKNASPAFDHTDDDDASIAGGDVQAVNENNYKVSYSAHNGKLTMITGLYEVEFENGTKEYYKVGDTIDLSGNWYALGAAPTATTAVSVSSGLKMVKNLAKIYDGYYKVSWVNAGVGTVGYAKTGNTVATTGACTTANAWYKTTTGYVQASAVSQVTVAAADIVITDGATAYRKVTVPNDQTVAGTIGTASALYTYTITTADGERYNNSTIYVKDNQKVTVTVTYVSGTISNTKDTITVACTDGSAGAALEFTTASVGTAPSGTIEVTAIDGDCTLSITGANS